MVKRLSDLIKASAYIFFAVHTFGQLKDIAGTTSYLNTGKLMGVESMLQMMWACFLSFLMASFIYGIGKIVESYGKDKVTDLTKS